MHIRSAAASTMAFIIGCAAFSANGTGKPPAGATTARLEGPYEDRRQAEIDFGLRSYALAPWRAYMDTWPASRWLEMPGVNFGDGAETTARLLAEAGFRSARVEWGWGNMAWDGGRFNNEEGMKRTMRALKAAGLRPLILLNAHHGVPCPTRWFNAKLAEDAPKGQRHVTLESVEGIRPRYSGLTNLNDYRAVYPIIESVDTATGRCELSAPLPVDLKAGDIVISETGVRPLSGSVNPDGSPNPDCQESIDAWMDYVATACRVAKEGLGTTDASDDAGFDIEVWNEYTFGSCFLNINNYYDPPIEFREPLVYRNAAGNESRGPESLLPMVVDFVRDPANHCPGVTLVNGFANQRPWDNLTERWPGLDAISRHFYAGASPRIVDAEHPDQPANGPVNALGKRDGTPDGRDWHTVVPGSYFIPTQRWACPEISHYALQTEFITRDTQPFPSTSGGPIPFTQHHRYGHNGDGRPGQVWRTEVNTFRAEWAGKIREEAGCEADDPRLVGVIHEMAARWLLRELVFCAHKGETTHNVFQAQGRDDFAFGVLPSTYFDALDAAGGLPTDAVRAAVGPQVRAVGRVTRLFREGKPFDVARKLEVDEVVEHDPRLVWKGDGTPANPDRFNRDDFAILPFQLDEQTFEIAFYVVTHDVSAVWRPDRDVFDPLRYSMPPQTFDISFENIRGKGAKVSVWDPVTDTEEAVQWLSGDGDGLKVRVSAADYPRFLRVVEKAPGPMLSGISFSRDADGTPTVSFTGNRKGKAEVTWGPFPGRGADGDLPGHHEAEVAVKAGKPVAVRLDGANVDTDAVAIEYEADDLEMRWPQWDYDLRGVLRFSLEGLRPTATVKIPVRDAPAMTLPVLPATPKPFEVDIPEANARHASAFDIRSETVPVTAESHDPAALAAAAQALLPVLAPTDIAEVSVADWNGVTAWRVRIVLDPTMHPGVRRLASETWIAPVLQSQRHALLRVTAEARDAAALEAARPSLDEILRGHAFRPAP